MGPADAVIGDIGITVPESRFNAAATSELVTLVRQSAELLTRRFTGTRPEPSQR